MYRLYRWLPGVTEQECLQCSFKGNDSVSRNHRQSPSAGRWFQALGAATANDWRQNVSPRVADRSLCLLPTDATGWHRWARYLGARPWSALNVSRHNLNWTRSWTGSQWRRSRNTWLMWSYFLAPTSNRAAAFRTDCSRSSRYLGASQTDRQLALAIPRSASLHAVKIRHGTKIGNIVTNHVAEV